jgi:hypothetical protein
MTAAQTCGCVRREQQMLNEAALDKRMDQIRPCLIEHPV